MSDSPPKADAGQGPAAVTPDAQPDDQKDAPVKPETLAGGALDDAAKAMDAVVVKSDVAAPAVATADAIAQDSTAPKPTGFVDNPKPAIDLMQLSATTSGMHQQYVAPGVQRQSLFSSTKYQFFFVMLSLGLTTFMLKGMMSGDALGIGGSKEGTSLSNPASSNEDPRQGFPDPNNVHSPPPITPQADFTVNAATIGGSALLPNPAHKGDGGAENKGGYAEETADLEAARLMVARDPDKALAMCDQHDVDYPRGMLDPEARVIRVEAYAKKGDDAKALALGNDFLDDYPHSPRAGRVVTIVEALKNKQEAGH